MTDEMKKAAEVYMNYEIQYEDETDIAEIECKSFEAGWTKCLETLAAKAGESLKNEIIMNLKVSQMIVNEFEEKVANEVYCKTALPLLAKIEMLEGKVKHGGEACHQKLIENLKLHMENQFLRERIELLEDWILKDVPVANRDDVRKRMNDFWEQK